MINVEELRDYCLSLGEGIEEKFPFAKFNGAGAVLVFYVCKHMFCYFDIDAFEVVTVKCQPELIPLLAEEQCAIVAPCNMSRKHWIGIRPDLAEDNLMRELVSNSYEIVKKKYSKCK